jgi:hypothetical protein
VALRIKISKWPRYQPLIKRSENPKVTTRGVESLLVDGGKRMRQIIRTHLKCPLIKKTRIPLMKISPLVICKLRAT